MKRYLKLRLEETKNNFIYTCKDYVFENGYAEIYLVAIYDRDSKKLIDFDTWLNEVPHQKYVPSYDTYYEEIFCQRYEEGRAEDDYYLENRDSEFISRLQDSVISGFNSFEELKEYAEENEDTHLLIIIQGIEESAKQDRLQEEEDYIRPLLEEAVDKWHSKHK